jgi:sugar-specific transcriptional regulator TrmB
MLERFGFTPTESKAYQALLISGPATGYAVAGQIGVARANAYQALEALAKRGAIRRSGTRPVLYVALPPVALAGELERGFRRDLGELEAALRALQRGPRRPMSGDLEVITSQDVLIGHVEAAADGTARELHLLSGGWADEVFEAVERAHRRGVRMTVVAFGAAAPDVPGVIRPAGSEADLRGRWGGLPLAAVSDDALAVHGIATDDGADGIAGTLPAFRALVREAIRSLRQEAVP